MSTEGRLGSAPQLSIRNEHSPDWDKDWTAACSPAQPDAERLLYVTDVPHCCDAFGRAEQRLSTRHAVIAALGRIESAPLRSTGTTITPR